MSFILDAATARREIARHAPSLAPEALEQLVQLYSEPRLAGTLSPEPVVIQPKVRISIVEGAQLYHLACSHGVTNSVEVGLAYGFSTVWILAGLAGREGARHVAIDPYEISHFAGVGLKQAERLGGGVEFEWIEEVAILAMPDLIRRERPIDFVFIDASHTFDATLVEFFLADKLVPVGGLIAFDDLWMRSIRAVLSFVLRNRNYELVRQPVKNLCVLRKLGEDHRQWDFFRPFRTRGFPPLEAYRDLRRKLAG